MVAADSSSPGYAASEALERLDLRVGRVVEASALPGARRPSLSLLIDFGALGQRISVAGLAVSYPDPSGLVGRLVVAAVNLPARRVAGTHSEVLVLAALCQDGGVALLGVDEAARPGDRVA